MTWIEVLGVASTVCAIFFGYMAFIRNRKKDDAEEGKSSGTMLSDIGYIKAGVDEIKSEQKEQRNANIKFAERLTAVEESTKQAHKRIDEIKKKGE